MKKNVLLIGAGRFGKHMAMQLNQLGHQVMAVDTDETRINDVMNIVTNAQIGDSTNAEFLKSLGVGNFDVCMVTIGDSFQNSLETTSLLKELGARYVVSRAERMYRKNSCCVMVQMRLYILKNTKQSGLQYAILRTIFLI